MDQVNAPTPDAVVEVKACFGPIVSPDSRLLILGTLPGEESLIRRQYYGHPRNHFWPIIAAAFGEVLPVSYDDRIAMLGVLMTGGTEAARQAFVERQPMGRLGTPEEIAALAVYLASDAAQFITGQAVVIDGGLTL